MRDHADQPCQPHAKVKTKENVNTDFQLIYSVYTGCVTNINNTNNHALCVSNFMFVISLQYDFVYVIRQLATCQMYAHKAAGFPDAARHFLLVMKFLQFLSAFPSFYYRLRKNSLFNSFVVFNLIRDFDKLTLT